MMMKIKRTKNINQDAFRKNWRAYRLAPVALAISTVFMLSACEQSDESVSLYTNAEDCAQKTPRKVNNVRLLIKMHCRKQRKLRLNMRHVKIVWLNLVKKMYSGFQPDRNANDNSKSNCIANSNCNANANSSWFNRKSS